MTSGIQGRPHKCWFSKLKTIKEKRKRQKYKDRVHHSSLPGCPEAKKHCKCVFSGPRPSHAWKKQFLVHPCHIVHGKDLQRASSSRCTEMLSLSGVPTCQMLPNSTAQASNGHSKLLNYHGGFPHNSTVPLFTPLRNWISTDDPGETGKATTWKWEKH